MKKTSVAILSILFVFILSTFSPAFGSYEALAAVEKPKKLIINNKTEEKLTITFKGDNTYKFNLKPNKNKVELMAGMYSYTFFACGIWQNGTVEITKNNQKIILPDCATATGMVKLTIQAMTGGDSPLIRSPGWLVYVGEYNFLFATGWLLLLSILVIVVVSLCTAPPKPEQIAGLTYATATAEQKKENRESWGLLEVLLTVLVLGLVVGLYLYFSFWLN